MPKPLHRITPERASTIPTTAQTPPIEFDRRVVIFLLRVKVDVMRITISRLQYESAPTSMILIYRVPVYSGDVEYDQQLVLLNGGKICQARLP